jgi:hypothetical protein
MTAFSPCGPLDVNPNFCAKITPFGLPQTQGSWQVEFQNGADTAALGLPPVSVIPATPVVFPSSVTIAANGATPTISWTLPAGTDPNAFRVNLFDKLQFAANGQNQIMLSTTLSPTATSFTIPASAGLTVGGNYVINFQVIETRDGEALPITFSDADILTRSSSFFDFSPAGGGGPPVIQLPMIDASGVYHFNVGSVGPGLATFIDPTLAIGYIYDIGQGDPDFASVILPDIGAAISIFPISSMAACFRPSSVPESNISFPPAGLPNSA